jgi:hypothetical protein
LCARHGYSPGPPSYTLTAEALTIHDRFYPVTLKAEAVDVSQIRVVDITLEPDWRPVLRTIANGHYPSGWFRVALDVLEPDKFVETVRQEWSGRL